MRRWLLMSIMLVSVIVPALRTRDRDPRRGLRRALWEFGAATVIWGFACVKIYWWLPE